MEALLDARYITKEGLHLNLQAYPSENIFIQGSIKRCDSHFDTLCGLTKPETGTVHVWGTDLYSLSDWEAAAFRRDNIGGISRESGLIPELRLIDQVALPMKLAGIKTEDILREIQNMTSDLLPMHSLYNKAGKCNARKQTHAAILRALIRKPELIILNGSLEDFDEINSDILWQVLLDTRPSGRALIYFSGGPAPEYVKWTRCLRI